MTNDQAPNQKQIQKTNDECSKLARCVASAIEALDFGACLVLDAGDLVLRAK
jgi:hypothetical protein